MKKVPGETFEVERKTLQDVFSQLPIKGETAFANTRGKFREKVKKQQLRYLREYVPDLKYILEEGEEILLASRSVSPFTHLEELTTFAWIYVIKRCLLVLTSRRILHFPSNYRFKPADSISQIRFQDIESFKGKGRITFRYKNGTREFFSRVRNGKRLVQLLKKSVTASSKSSPYAARQHLCPRCAAPLGRNRFSCPRCRFRFKRPRTAGLYSIFLPGGGYFFTRHPLLGLGSAVTELALLFTAVFFLLGFFNSPEKDFAWLFAGIAAGSAFIVGKLVSFYHSRQFLAEFIPVKKRFERISRKTPVARPEVVGFQDGFEEEKVTFY